MKYIGRSQHRGHLEQQRSHNMLKEAQIGETSYSALLHGPDTPPSQSEPAWGTPVSELESPAAAAAGSSLQVKNVRGDQEHPDELLPGRDQGSLQQYGVESVVVFQPSIKQNFPEQFKGDNQKICLEVPSHQTFDLESSRENKQTWPAQFTGYQTQHFGEPCTQGKQVPQSFSQLSCKQGVHDKNLNQRRDFVVFNREWDGQQQVPSDAISTSLPSTGQSIKEQHPRMAFEIANIDLCHNQPPYGKTGETSYNQQESGHASNNMASQHHDSWNAPQEHMIDTGFVNPHADAKYTDWGMSVWQQGQHFAPSCASGTFHMGPNYAEYGWYMGPTTLPDPASAMANGFAHFNAEEFYPPATRSARDGTGFGSISETETETAFPPSFESASCYQGPQVNYMSATSCIAGVGMPVHGAGQNRSRQGFLEQQDYARQKNFVPMFHAGGQMGQSQFHSSLSQPVVNAMQGEQRQSAKRGSDTVADIGSSLCEKDDIEGPKLKKQRDFSEVNMHPYNLRCAQPSSNFGGQNARLKTGPCSDVYRNLQGDGTFARKNTFYAVGSSFVGSEKGHNIQPVFGNSCSESVLSLESYSSEGINGEIPQSTVPPNLAPIEVCMQGPVQSFPQSVLPFEDEQVQGQAVNENCHQSEKANGTQIQEQYYPCMRQSGERAQVARASSVLKSPVCSRSMATGKKNYHTRMLSHGVHSVALHAFPDSQSSMLSPWNDFEGPSSMSMSNITSQDSQVMHKAQFGSPGGSQFCTPMGQPIGVQPQLLGQRSAQSVHLSNLQPPAHAQEFTYPTALPPDTGSQLRGFSRSPMRKFFPPPSFQSPPMHPCSDSMEKETYHHSEGGHLVAMGKSISVSESDMELQAFHISGAGNTRSRSTANNVFYTQSPNPGVQKDVFRGIPSGPKNAEPHESANKLYSRPSEKEQSITSQVSACPKYVVSDGVSASTVQVTGNRNNAAYIGHQNFGTESATFRGREQTCPPKVAPGHPFPHQFLSPTADSRAPIALQPKKRKKPVSLLIPWHIEATQPRVQLPSISKSEVMWANAANRIPEKDGREVLDEGRSRLENRLRLTTQLMQQLISPLPIVLMHSDKPMDYEHGIYYVTRFALGEACRLMAGFERKFEPAVKSMDIKSMGIQGQTRMSNRMKDVAMTKLVERFMERVKRLDLELARFECSSMSAVELRSKSHELGNLSIVNRLGKHHGTAFCLDTDRRLAADSLTGCSPPFPPVGRRLPPQKYVIPVPMSRTILPEGVRCLSL